MGSAGNWVTNGANHSSKGIKSMLLNCRALLLHLALVIPSLAALKFAVECFEIHNFRWHTECGAFCISACWPMTPSALGPHSPSKEDNI